MNALKLDHRYLEPIPEPLYVNNFAASASQRHKSVICIMSLFSRMFLKTFHSRGNALRNLSEVCQLQEQKLLQCVMYFRLCGKASEGRKLEAKIAVPAPK